MQLKKEKMSLNSPRKWSKNGVEENLIKRENSTLLQNALLTFLSESINSVTENMKVSETMEECFAHFFRIF